MNNRPKFKLSFSENLLVIFKLFTNILNLRCDVNLDQIHTELSSV